MEKVYFSREGIEKFLDQIRNIEGQMREIQSKIDEYAKTGGNLWHDNFAYENARRDLMMLNDRLGQFYSIRSNAEVVTYPKHIEHVQLGCKATFKYFKVL